MVTPVITSWILVPVSIDLTTDQPSNPGRLLAAVKSTGGELLVAALVARMVYLSIQLFNQDDIAQQSRPVADTGLDCAAPITMSPPASTRTSDIA